MRKNIQLLLVIILIGNYAFTQTKIDSLKLLLKEKKFGSNQKLNVLGDLTKELVRNNNKEQGRVS